MSKYRQAAKVDANQRIIVQALRQIPGCTVETGKDDILVGYKSITRWYEIKTPDCVGKDGKILDSAKKSKQKELEREWRGHYRIVSSVGEILQDMGLL